MPETIFASVVSVLARLGLLLRFAFASGSTFHSCLGVVSHQGAGAFSLGGGVPRVLLVLLSIVVLAPSAASHRFFRWISRLTTDPSGRLFAAVLVPRFNLFRPLSPR